MTLVPVPQTTREPGTRQFTNKKMVTPPVTSGQAKTVRGVTSCMHADTELRNVLVKASPFDRGSSPGRGWPLANV